VSSIPVVTSLEDHWTWRPDWAADRPCLLWYLTFTGQPVLADLVETARARLSSVAAVDPVPAPWLHLTLDDVGFEDEVAPEQVRDVVARVFAAVAEQPLPPLELGPVNTMVDALVLEAAPGDALVELRDLLRTCTEEVLPGAASALDAFWPHVTLAYSNAPVGRAALLAALDDLGEARLVVEPQLVLAAVTRREKHYQWTSRALVTGSGGPRTDPGPPPPG
jgi:2'-5' RNA ligase